MKLKIFILAIIFIVLTLKCVPMNIVVSDSLQPFLNNSIDIVKVDTIKTSYGKELMFKIYYKHSGR